MNSITNRFQSARVLIIGDLMLDEYVRGSVSRICPEAPVPVLDVQSRYYTPGGAANVAMNVAGLSANVRLVGPVGRDVPGNHLRQLLLEQTGSDSGLVDAGVRGTITKTRIVAGQQQICRIDQGVTSEITGPLLDAIIETARTHVEWCSVVVLSDYAKGTINPALCQAVISIARSMNKLVVVDPKSKDFTKYRGCTVITPNASEASLASGVTIDSELSLHRAANTLTEQLPGTRILITRGPDGMALFEHGSEPFMVPTVARKLFDVVGAGDTAVAALSVSLAAGFSMSEAVVWANIAAGIVVEKHGTASVSMQELLGHDESTEFMRSIGVRAASAALSV